MSAEEADPCPCEMKSPVEGVDPVADDERLVKIVAIRGHVQFSAAGEITLALAAISQDDIAGKIDSAGERRSVSTFRDGLTTKQELERRAKALNKVPEWADDPLAALAQAATLRSIKDISSRREVCIFAEPTGETDKLGPCLTHAGILRSRALPNSTPPASGPQAKAPGSRLSWATLRLAVAEKFTELKHVCSNTKASVHSVK